MVYIDTLTKAKEPKKIEKLKKSKSKPVKQKKRWWLWLILIIIIAFSWALLWFRTEIKKPVVLAKPVMIEIKSGEGVDEISQKLANAGVINSTLVFKSYLVFKRQTGKLQSGLYKFSGSVTLSQVAEAVVLGKAAENKVTIPEGMRIEEMALYLEAKHLVKADNFLAEARNVGKFQKKYSFLNNAKNMTSLEGFLFPDTYRLKIEATSEEIIEKMLDNFQEKINKNYAKELKKQNKSYLDVLTLASIVEREVKNKTEKAIVAGIYQNRLRIDMKLQADPTVQYAKESQNPSKKFQDFWQKITVQDYHQVNSKYNTYLFNGLPPGPIANPGLDSIKAVLSPKSSDYLYFFTPDGEIYYSKTAEEHEQQKAKYLK